ncbi:MAG: ABC transporter permease [Lentimicrobium sp.]|nr:ABC transporter permease [Lentimicrobium sp.]
MVKDIFNHSLKALLKQRSYVIINIIGLSAGIASSLIICLVILHELSYDRFHEKGDRIFRIILDGKISGQEILAASTASPIGPATKAEFPEVEEFLRINGWGETIIRYEDQIFTEDKFIEADSSFFKVFTIPLLRGNPKNALNEKRTLTISESTARKIFADSDPIDKLVYVSTDPNPYRITGVFEDIPENSHFQANMIGSFMTNHRANDTQWTSNSFSTYLLLKEGSDPKSVDEKLIPLLAKNVGPELKKFLGITIEEFINQGNRYSLFLQPLGDIHLNPGIQQELKAASDPKYLWIFGSIAVLVIIIASINFMNLSTAQASKRAKEIGIKKVVGSSRGALTWQFISETIMLSFLSLLVALIITSIALPYFSSLLDTHLTLDLTAEWYYIPFLIFLAIFIGLAAGSYPAFYMSSFNPYMVLKGRIKAGKSSRYLRSGLVVLQFSISIILIAGTLIMFRQIRYMSNKDLGFNKENVIVIKRADAIGGKIAEFKNSIKSIPGVVSVSASTAVPGHSNNNNGYMIKGRTDESFLMQTNWVDYDYLDVYGIKLESGRFFSKEHGTDHLACIINQEAVKDFSLTKPFETRVITNYGPDETQELSSVIGIVKDFHFESLKAEIVPYIMLLKSEDTHWGYFSVRLAANASQNTLDEIEEVWQSYTANSPLQFFFMDKDVEQMYKSERQNAWLAIIFTILAILIASLGLYGLTSFTVQQRTREIGIRKTFGASVGRIWFLIAREIIILLTVSLAISAPFIYLAADNWLNNYHYRIQINPFDFVSGFAVALCIALATISYRAIKAANVNPAVSLRYE